MPGTAPSGDSGVHQKPRTLSGGRRRSRTENVEVLLICMPFQSLGGPSLGSSLLAAGLRSRGITSRVLYPGLGLASKLGPRAYIELSELWFHSDYHQIGEWIFSQALFTPSEDARQRYLDEVLRTPPRNHRHLGDPVPEDLIKSVDRSGEWIQEFLDECADEVLSHRPSIVGFSCMFQQKKPGT